jgi:hypothetical protein
MTIAWYRKGREEEAENWCEPVGVQKGWRLERGEAVQRFGACLVCDAHPVTRQVSRVQVSLETPHYS